MGSWIYRKGFSLVEVMISLLLVSVILAATMPVITSTKLTGNMSSPWSGTSVSSNISYCKGGNCMTETGGSILSTGTFDGGSSIDSFTTGAGTKFFWYPKKAALRVGYIDSDQWNDTNIGNYSAVIGGFNNKATGYGSSTSGGYNNTASGTYSSISGGYLNTASASASAISGGYSNTASGSYSLASGGYGNVASATYSSISGGYSNTASGNYSAITGGRSNTTSTYYSAITGGQNNAASGYYSAITGGRYNTVSGFASMVSGGYYSTASGNNSFVGGGSYNIAGGNNSFVAGGWDNEISGSDSRFNGIFVGHSNFIEGNVNSGANVIIGGASNSIVGNPTTHCIAGGNNIKINASNSSLAFGYNEDPNQYFQGDGRVWLYGLGGSSSNDTLWVWGNIRATGSVSGTSWSDIRLKNILGNYNKGLNEINSLNVVKFRYKKNKRLGYTDHEPERVGLIAQEVQKILPDAVNKDEAGYLTIDFTPINYTMINAIKELKNMFDKFFKSTNNSINQLRAENVQLKKRISILEKRLDTLEKKK